MARDALGWDIVDLVKERKGQPLVDIFTREVKDFSKIKLAKAFVRWSREHDATELSEKERDGWGRLITAINAALK